MAIDRRVFFKASAALAFVASGSGPSRSAKGPLFAAARRRPDGGYSAAIFSADGRDVFSIPLPGRGHDIAVCPVSRRCVAFGRRPASFAVAFSTDRTLPPTIFEAPADRHMYGHGVFSPDGRLLYTTENDFTHGRGVIGIYDATARFRRLGEFASHGLGPHDIALIDRGRVLVVANGGLREHPDVGGGRRILNADAIETSLAYVDASTGDLIERHALPAGGALSLRHLDACVDGTVILGAQSVTEAQAGRSAPGRLLFRHRRQEVLGSNSLPMVDDNALGGYVSSVAVDGGGEIAGATSSRTGSIVFIDIASWRVLAIHGLRDVSGIARGPQIGTFLVTSGIGDLRLDSPAGASAAVSTVWNWDNHAVQITDGEAR